MPNQPDRNLAIERLLREARPGTAMAADGPCVTSEELAAWLDQGLTEAESARLEVHLAACPACQTLLGAYAATAPAVDSHSRAWTRAALPFAAAAVLVFGVWMAGTRWGQQPAQGTAERQMARLEEPPAAPVIPAPAERAGQPRRDLADLERANRPAATQERKVVSVPVAIDQSAAKERSTDLAAPPAAASPPSELRVAVASPPAPAPQPGASAREAATADRATANAEADRAKQELASASPVPARARSEGLSRLATAPLAKAADTRLAFSSPDGAWRWRIAGAALDVSSDGGGMWLPATGITPVDLENVTSGASPGRGVIWLVGQGGLVLVSTDGRRFTRAVPPAAVPLSRVQAVDASTASVQAADGRTWRTGDGGRTWNRLP